MASLVSHFFATRRNDFVEMALHHFVTIYLYSGCYLLNCTEIGTVIAFLHDIADITTPLTKTLNETHFETATVIVFLFNTLSWAYTRNYVFVLIIYNIIFNIHENFNEEPLMRPYFSFLLGCLALLHYYWLYLMLLIFYNFATEGSTEDIQNRI